MTFVGRLCCVSVISIVALAATTARAQVADLEYLPPPWERDEGGAVLELAIDLGLLDRGTTGIGDPLLDQGYDHGGGPVAGIGARLLFPFADGDYFHHGATLRLSHHGGGSFGLSERVGFVWTSLDATYAFRTNFPCMSDDDRKVYLTGLVGVTGTRADAGTGEGPRDEHWNQRVAASTELDHLALGPMLGLDLSVHFGALLAGVMLDLRQIFALGEGPISRSTVATGTLRFGVAIDGLFSGPDRSELVALR